jgi:hypothetical protein
MNEQTTAEVSRPQHQILVDEFLDLDKQCQEIIEKFNTGKILYDAMPTDGGSGSLKEFMDKLVAKFNAARAFLNLLIEKRNAKLQEVSAAMRSLVMAGENVQRGPDGKASVQRYGPFEVSSKTFRGFTPETLFGELQKLGLYERVLDLKQINKNSGAEEAAIQQEWKIAYETVKNWLREQNLEEVLQNAYEEKEGTPAVTGPKPLAMLGEVDTNKKGKK